MTSLDDTNKLLKLDFNERSDKLNPLAIEFNLCNSLWQYPDRQPLEEIIAEQNTLSANQVLCTNGGDEAIMILMRIINEGTKLILPLPAFSQYTWGIQSWQLTADVIPSNNDLSINIEKTRQAITTNKQSVTVLTRPNNPTGESIDYDFLLGIIELAKKSNGWVFLDEAYVEFSDEETSPETLLNQFDNLVILRTLSKAYGLAGIRLGYLLGSKQIIEQFRVRCMPFNLSTPSIELATKALTNQNQLEVKTYCEIIRQNRNQIFNWLVSVGINVFPSQANFLFMVLPSDQAKAVKSFLAKNHILVRGFNENELSNCLRITIPFEIERLLDLLKQCLQPQLICIDMDGVLIDTSGSYDQCVIATVKQLSGEIITIDSIEEVRQQGGYNNDWVLSKKLLDDLGFSFNLEQVTQIFQSIYLGKNNDGLVANELAIISSKLVNKIKHSSNVEFAVVTGRPRNEARSGQALINLSELELISLDDVTQGKPNPEGIQKLQQKYSNSSWMCGDNPDDMQAAISSNSLAIGIGEGKVESLYHAGADIVLKDINELEKWLCPIN